jgi:acyl-CoA synthetase (NDP forming)
MMAGGEYLETIPTYAFPESVAKVLSKVATYSEWLKTPIGVVPAFDDTDEARAAIVLQTALKDRGEGWLTAEETRSILDAFHIPQVAGGVARTEEEAATIAGQVGFPVAVKLASHSIVHKTEIGAVRLHLNTVAEVREGFDEIADDLRRREQLAAMDGVLVQSMVRDGVELVIGVTDDPLFGPLIGFGLGGIHVEILGDVQFRVTPLTDGDAHEMVRSIRGYRLLEGYRGHAAADLAAIEEILLRISYMIERFPQISELDLNPLFALAPGEGCRVVDARMRVRTP